MKQKTIGLIVKYNDDGEPAGSAGSPVLNVLLKQNLSNVLVIVTRYFGGILLGIGGLVNSYTAVTAKALKKTEHIKKMFFYEVNLNIKNEKFDYFKKYLIKNDIKILKIEYLNNIEIKMKIEIERSNFEKFKENKKQIENFEITKIKIIKEKYI